VTSAARPREAARLALRGAFWSCVYVLVAVSPLAVGLLEDLPRRTWLTEFSVALGFLGLVIFALQFGLVARFQHVSAPFGMDALLQYHRQIAFVALAFALVHPVILFLEDPGKLRLLNPVTAPARARLGMAAVLALLGIVGISVFRKRLGIRYEVWQLLHGLLAVAVVGLSLAHALGVGFYTGRGASRALWVALSAGLAALLGWVRVVKPLLRLRRPWRVEEVVAERGSSWTLVLAPEGHAGFRFEPGQFGWLILGRSPFALTQHPFSISSSAAGPGRIAFTIKARGDFTATVGRVAPGTRAYVDGPYGLFTMERHGGSGFVLIAGGVGITPLISMVRTMADRGDARPVTLVYGNKDWEGVTFREELEALSKRMNLRVVHVLEQPPGGWAGEKGFVTAELLRRHLPAGYEGLRYFVCGPAPMMDAMERELASLGVPDARVVTERFEMV
jgi:predicted ferric reductase